MAKTIQVYISDEKLLEEAKFILNKSNISMAEFVQLCLKNLVEETNC
jgi:antitoxin component of RelBE/YafQ-DinJ toxin-antitoxin module